MSMTNTAHALGPMSERGLAASALGILGTVDELPAGATGALKFEELGVVLVESRRICWAAAVPMRLRLTDILCNKRVPPIPRAAIEEVYRGCKAKGRPLGEALVESGLVSESGLKSAIRQHTSEAILHLARAQAVADAFLPHTQRGYDPRFSFTSCEILASLSSTGDPARAKAAELELEAVLVPESTGAAFVRSEFAPGAQIIAVSADCDLPVIDLVEVCNWATGLLDVAQAIDAQVRVVRVAWCGRTSLVTWRKYAVDYAALCSSGAAAARLVSELGRRSHGDVPPESLTRKVRGP